MKRVPLMVDRMLTLIWKESGNRGPMPEAMRAELRDRISANVQESMPPPAPPAVTHTGRNG